MELLPPVGWADVATKQDFGAIDVRFAAIDPRLDSLDTRLAGIDSRVATLEGRFDDLAREIRGQTWRLMTLMVAVVGVVVAAVRF